MFRGVLVHTLILLGGALWAGQAQAQVADLVINHSDSPDPGPAGGVFTYTVRIDNNGPNTATAVALSDTLPAGSTFVDVTATAGSCTESGGVVSCTLGDLAFNTNQTVTIRVRLPSSGVWVNTATASSSSTDPNTSNNVNSTQTTTVVAAADLVLTAVPSAATVTAGESFSYALTAANNGPDPVSGSQTITFSVPSGASVTSVPTGTGWSCAPSSGYPLGSGSITCTRAASLASGASAPVLTVPAVTHVNGTVTAAFAVAGFKSDGSTMPDSNQGNNTATADVSSTAGSDVSITKAPASGTVAQGSNVTYTLTPRLNGGMPLAGQPITVTDTLGVGLTYVSATGSGWVCDATALPVITCTRTEYTGTNYTNMPTISVVALAANAGTLTNQASVSTPLTDPVPANNQATSNLTSSNDADLQMTKSASPNPVAPGVPYNYTMTVRNLGPLAVPAGQDIVIADVVPAGVTLNTLVSAAGWTCDALPFTGNGAATWGCTRTTGLNVNTNAVVTVSATMAGAGSGTNNACVALGAGARTDSNSANNCAGAAVAASVTTADLRVVSKTANPDPVVAGQDLTYTIVVDNLGPDTATNVVVTDVLASLVSTGGFQSATASQGSCTPNTVTNGTAQTLSCNVGTLALNASATITVVVRPDIAVSGARSNTVSVRSLDVGDPVLSNNSLTISSQVTALADLQVTKTAAPATVPAGAPLTFVTTVRNLGPSNAQTVQVVDTLPANAAFINLVSVSGGGTCAPIAAGTVGGSLTCNWASIVDGAQQTITYRMRPLGSAAGGNVVNSVQATTATLETNTTNNTATTTTPVTAPQLDILVNKVDSADPVNLGQSTTYTITVSNSGPSYGTNVVMTDEFPAPGSSPTATFSYQGALTVNGGGSCTAPAIGATSGTLRCSFPGLDSGQSATITYQMTAESLSVAGATSGTTFNRASVTVDETETLLTNNTVTHDTTARRSTIATDMQLTKTGPAGPLDPGATANYTLLVTNNGPVASDGAVVVDVLPAGLEFVSAAGCVHASGRVTCSVGPLAVGASRSFTLSTRLASPYTGARPLVNTASVDLPGDILPGNNSSSATTTVSAAAPAASIPTLSQWGLMLLSALLALMAVRQQRSRR